jgi:hypothetical protein
MIEDADDAEAFRREMEREMEEVRLALNGLPCAYTDALWAKIAADLPSGTDMATARRRLERMCGRCMWEVSLFKSMGLNGKGVAELVVHLKFVTAARAFVEAYTAQIDNLYEQVTHQFEEPRKNRRQPLIAEITALADWHEKFVDDVGPPKGEGTRNVPRSMLLRRLRIAWREFGGRGKSAEERFLANASKLALEPEDELTPSGARDFIRGKKPSQKTGVKKKRVSGKHPKKII